MVFLGVFFDNLNCETEWRLFSGICIIFPAVLGLWMFWMPRSPIFLVSKGDLEGAKKSLEFFRGKSRDVTEELNQIKEEYAESQKIGSVGFFQVTFNKKPKKCLNKMFLLQIWKKKEYLKPMCISLVLMSLQQLSGMNYVLSYTQEIFKVTAFNHLSSKKKR